MGYPRHKLEITGRVGTHDQFLSPFTMMEWVLKIPTYLAEKLEKRKDDPRKGEQCKLSYCLRPVKSVIRSATGCVSYKMAAASIPPSKSHTTTLVGFSLITNMQKRVFWEITSTQSSLHSTKTPQLVKHRLLECNTRVWFPRSGVRLKSLHKKQVPRRCCCCCSSRNYILRITCITNICV